MSPTVDEPVHLFAGYSYLTWDDFRANPEHPPLAKVWAALPLLAFDIKDPRSSGPYWDLIPTGSPRKPHTINIAAEMLFRQNDAKTLFFYAKLQMIVLGMVLGVFVYLWSKKLFGLEAGIASLFIYCLDPTILAHSQLIHTDLMFTTFFFIGTYFFCQVLRQLTWINLILAALFFGLAVNSKYSYIAILVVWTTLGLVKLISSEPQRRAIGKARDLYGHWEKAVLLAGVAGYIFAVSYFLIWAIYGFRFNAIPGGGLHLPMAQEMPRNPMLQGLVSFLINHELFPEAWIYGQLFVLNHLDRAAYLLGQYSDNGFWLYFPVAFAVKTPLPTVLMAGALTIWIYKRGIQPAKLFLLIPIVVYFSLAVLSRLNIGLRHILPIYPFLFVLVGGMIAELWLSGTRPKRVTVVLLSLWYIWSCVNIYPHYLAFFNEIAGGPKNGYKVLVDSNLDWGQDLPGLKEWMETNGVKRIQFLYFGFYNAAEPQHYGIDAVYLPGSWVIERPSAKRNDDLPDYLAISATHLYGPTLNEEQKELVKPFKTIVPVTTVGHSILIYRIDRAIEEFRKAVQINPNSAEAHYSLATLLENGGELDEAMYHYRSALQLSAAYKKTIYATGNSLARWGEVEKAINHYRVVLESDSSFADAHDRLGLMLVVRGELREATEHFHQALKLDPMRSETQFNLGVALARQGYLPEAIQHFQEALKIRPDHPEAYISLGRILASQGHIDNAIDLFRHALQIQPDSAEAHESLAMALNEKGRKYEAIQEFQEALRLKASGESEIQAHR